MGRLSLKSNIPQLESRIRFRPCIGVLTIPLSQGLLRQSGGKKYVASENVSPGYFTLLVQKEFAGSLADRCAEETGEEGMILET